MSATLFSFGVSDVKADIDLDYRKEISIKVTNALRDENWSVLEAMANEFGKNNSRTPSGKSCLALYEDDLLRDIGIVQLRSDDDIRNGVYKQKTTEELNGPIPSQYDRVNESWDALGKKLDKWRSAYPDSPNPQIAKAIYFFNRGNYFIGQQWAQNVYREAWPMLALNLASANDILTGLQKSNKRSPIWFSIKFRILGVISAPREEFDALISDALANAQGYENALTAAFTYLQPRWGGTYQKMEDFAIAANNKTLDFDFGGMYASLYWNLAAYGPDEIDSEFFSRTKSSWPKMQKSFNNMLKHYPMERNYAGYALFSCMANDLTLTKKLLSKAGVSTFTEYWPIELRQRCVSRN